MHLWCRSRTRGKAGRMAAGLTMGALAALLSWCALPACSAAPVDRRAGEYQIKAAYLYNFLHFIHWPAPTVEPPPAARTITIGIVGDDPFNGSFTPVEGRTVGTSGPRLLIRRYGTYEEGMDLADCQLLFVCRSEQAVLPSILRSVSHSPILTVSDAGGFVAAGGMIELVERAGRVRWVVNRTALAEVSLRANAQLLRNATKVIGTPASNRVDAVRLPLSEESRR
jgi:hypothetical protein